LEFLKKCKTFQYMHLYKYIPQNLVLTFPLIKIQYCETSSIDHNFFYSTTSQFLTNNGILTTFMMVFICIGVCDLEHMMVTLFPLNFVIQ
jgi:hypothetical protein